MLPLVLSALLSLAAPAGAEQRLPSCHELNRLWRSRYLALLKPDVEWGAAPLECALSAEYLSEEQKRDIGLARAAYFLDSTIWTDRRINAGPLVPGGGISAPPNMLEWVGARVKGLHIQTAANAVPYAENGVVNLARPDFRFEDMGVGVAAQLIHESRHLGFPPYGHHQCRTPGRQGYDCDPTIAEDFEGGGSHAVAILWLAWIRDRSLWPASVKKEAEDTVVDLLQTRINDRVNADRFACRYVGRYVINAGRACNPETP